MSETNKMIARKEGRVGYLIFNNPERHNAVSLEMWAATTEILRDANSPQSPASRLRAPRPIGTRPCVLLSRTIGLSGSVWGGDACVSEPPPAGVRLESPGLDRFDRERRLVQRSPDQG